jgi:hypothetical protein
MIVSKCWRRSDNHPIQTFGRISHPPEVNATAIRHGTYEDLLFELEPMARHSALSFAQFNRARFRFTINRRKPRRQLFGIGGRKLREVDMA